MLQAKCIQKFKKNNTIYAYRIQDFQGNTRDVYSDQLKQAIRNNEINIVNLRLTSDNRLVSTTLTQQTQKSTSTKYKTSKISNKQIQSIIDKAKLLGIHTEELPTACNHKCYLISMSDTQHIVYIPDDVTKLNQTALAAVFTFSIKYLQGSLKVVGGKNIKDASFMFYKCQAQSIDLSSFDTSSVLDMHNMFYNCEAKSIDLRKLNTSNVIDMQHMFEWCKAQSLDLSSFDTSKVTNMKRMFYNCQAKLIDISSFDTSKVINMDRMFCDCQAKSLDLSSFNTSKVTNMNCMFEYCQAKSIDLRGFDTSDVIDMSGMFYNCEAQSLDLSRFNTSKVTDMSGMFYNCKAQSIDLSSFDTSNVTEMSNMFYECRAKIKAKDIRILSIVRSV